eukprot:1391487-Amorphochlora_amoeboformis.AAC.1
MGNDACNASGSRSTTKPSSNVRMDGTVQTDNLDAYLAFAQQCQSKRVCVFIGIVAEPGME